MGTLSLSGIYMVSVLVFLLNALQPALHAAIHLVGVEKHCFSEASNQYTGLAGRAWAERHVGGLKGDNSGACLNASCTCVYHKPYVAILQPRLN